MTYAKFENGAVIYPPHNCGNRVNVHLDPSYCESNGFTLKTDEEIAAYEAEHPLAVVQSRFLKLDIRRAMRELGIENLLDNVLTLDDRFAKDWADAPNNEIDLNDPMVSEALAADGITDEHIAAIKSKILEG